MNNNFKFELGKENFESNYGKNIVEYGLFSNNGDIESK